MRQESSDIVRMLRIAAWVWLGYLAALFVVDMWMYAGVPRSMLSGYYLGNVVVAVIFLILCHWTWIGETLGRFYIPLMLLIISGLPIVLGRVFLRQLPPGPMSNIEGITLRTLPILFIALVITAWRYDWRAVIVFAVGTAVLEIGIVQAVPLLQANAAHAVTFISIVRSVSFLVVGYFINRLMRQLQAQQDALAQANAQLTHYASALETLTVSRERNRLARELHDTLAHTLSGLSVQLETAKAYWDVEPETARELLAQSLAVTRSGLDETRRALKALRASPLDDLGLLLAVKSLAESAAERGKLRLELSLPEQDPALSPDVEQCIYRIAQEAIENVVHHAHAENLAVRLTVDQAGVDLLVEDDGLGANIEQSAQAGHYGLAGMRERAELAGGQLTINSQPKQGTCIQLSLAR